MYVNQRSCLPCTACCQGWLNISEDAVQAHLGSPCVHCSSQGCSVYEKRPVNPCQTFYCAWRQKDTPLIELMRPDLSGVIVVMDRIVWEDQKVIVGIPTGPQIPEKSLSYLLGLSRLTEMNLLTVRFSLDSSYQYTGKSRVSAYGEGLFVEAMKDKFKDGLLNW